MKLTIEQLKEFSTLNEQFLISVARHQDETPTGSLIVSSDINKEVQRGIVVCAEEQKYVGCQVIFPIDGAIEFDKFVDIEDSAENAYYLVRSKSVFLIEKLCDTKE